MTIPASQIAAAHAVDILATARCFTTLKRDGVHEHVGPCPRCGGRDRFAVNTRKRVFNCRGCGARGDVIDLVMLARGASFAEAVAELAGGAPVANWPPRASNPSPDEVAERNRRSALQIFDGAGPVVGSLAERYLAGRSIDIEKLVDVDDVLRFEPRCRFGDGRLPCLVALVRNVLTNEPQAIQRTALDANGRKIDRRGLGPKTGGAVKLWADEAVTTGLVVGEGLETVASAATEITRKDGTLLQPAWALLDRINVRDFPVLPGVEALTILVDNDATGDGQAAAEACARRWLAEGRDVTRLTPKLIGSDFNDIVAGDLRGAA